MRVLLTADTVGGVWTYALELAQALSARGVRVDLATMGALPSREQEAEAAGVPGLTLHASEYKLEWMQEPWEDVHRAGEWLLDLEARLRPDVVHLNGYAHGALPWRAPCMVVAHSCVLSWWDAVKGEAAPPEWCRYREEVTAGLRAASLVAAPTAAMLAALERHYGALPPTRVIYNGRRSDLFGSRPKEPFVFSAGRLWDEAKNVGALETAGPRLPWPVYVAGDSQHPDGGTRGCSGVRLLGRLPFDELTDWLGRASIYALPARYEPFGLSALEAAFSGCALVLGDIPTLREVWGDAAVFVPPDDPAELSRALRSLMTDPAGRAEMAARAQSRAQRFTPERMADEYLAAYRSLMRDAPRVLVEDEEEEPVCAS